MACLLHIRGIQGYTFGILITHCRQGQELGRLCICLHINHFNAEVLQIWDHRLYSHRDYCSLHILLDNSYI